MNWSRLKPILALSLPIIGGMVSQNVLNLVDTAMVGFLGNAALAAVGISSFALFLFQSFILAASSGVQSMAARRKGEGNVGEIAASLNSGLIYVLVLGIPLTACLYHSVPFLFSLLNDDPMVIKEGTSYLQLRTLAIVFVGINICFRGYWSAIGKTDYYMVTLIVMHAANIILNYIFIFGESGIPPMGVRGAALGTVCATALGSLIYLVLAFRVARTHGFLSKGFSIEKWQVFLGIVIPTGVQNLFFAGGFTALFWIIGKVGTQELAAANVLINIMLTAILPAIAFGLAAATLVSESLGEGEPDEAMAWGWEVTIVGSISLVGLGIPMVVSPSSILGLFIHNPETLQVAVYPLQIFGSAIAFEAIGLVLMNAIIGAGAAKTAMKISITLQWLLFLPIAYYVGPVAGYGLTGIWLAQASYRILQAGIFARLWYRGDWASSKA